MLREDTLFRSYLETILYFVEMKKNRLLKQTTQRSCYIFAWTWSQTGVTIVEGLVFFQL